MSELLTTRQERDLRRRVRRLHEGHAVKIHTHEWNRFVEISKDLHPGRREWRCLFRDGKVEINRLDV